MSTPTELLEKKIRRREDQLRAREAETAAREAELEDLKESLQKLQSTHDGIRSAIEDALSDSPAMIAASDVLEMAAVEGETNNKLFTSGHLTAEEAVRLGLASMKNDLGSRGLVKMLIQSAVEISQLDAEGVIKAALETVRRSDLSTSDVVLAAMQAARNSRNIVASEIIGPAVGISMELGFETPVVVKEMFVAAVRRDPAAIRTSVLSVLGCAMGMGTTHGEIKDIMEAFSNEVKHGAFGQGAGDDPGKKVRFVTPPEAQDSNPLPTQQPENPQPRSSSPVYGDNADPSVVQAMVNGALQSINNGGPGLSALGDPFTMLAQWPAEYASATEALHNIMTDTSDTVTEASSSKHSIDDDDVEEAESRPSKKARIHREEDRDSDQ